MEPGNIFKTKDGIKMTEEILEEEVYMVQIDEEGNITKVLPV